VAIEEADDGLTAIEKYKAITSDNNESVDLFVLGEIILSSSLSVIYHHNHCYNITIIHPSTSSSSSLLL
jgi:hypothetical protein